MHTVSREYVSGGKCSARMRDEPFSARRANEEKDDLEEKACGEQENTELVEGALTSAAG